jgi:hypothetical protein
MFFDGRQIVCLRELRQAVAKVANAGENEFLTNEHAEVRDGC